MIARNLRISSALAPALRLNRTTVKETDRLHRAIVDCARRRDIAAARCIYRAGASPAGFSTRNRPGLCLAAAATVGFRTEFCAAWSRSGLAWELKARDAARREDSLRAVAYYETQRREREEREFQQGREAMAREVAERNRRNGWPC
jgi:hypothetical protein